MEHAPIFVRLDEIRRKGWESEEGNRFFDRQKRQADEGSEETQRYLNKMMQAIADEMQRMTGAFTICDRAYSAVDNDRQRRILDCCMAPGTYLQAALEHNPGAGALAFTLPPPLGGHKLLLEEDETRGLVIKLLDVTMLAADMGVTPDEIPPDHPDAAAFLPQQVEPGRHFDLVLCDGQVLRTHEPHRAAYRERREARRLTLTQLILGLEHLRPGGTMIVLLHKVEAWDTACLVRTFHAFSTVRLFKPRRGHAKRSSFYMIATNIRAEDQAAVAAVEEWKATWKVATFASEDEYAASRQECVGVDELLDQFGPELISLGHHVWRVQAEALEKAPFNRR
ncbi:hypothetical protein M406DRAFT_338832 [Cryphonectria parasitica EP155]|uniref:Ribosomal RNA methyltransferase FtsJ domain-containing protein n=1 Tax=Cryphonectria parasitica (strain ATCC 38755 / EP155) TaxID=660469 RepID=A0A9P5CPN1_CRYP1|nr:uncharacterized protein M406DRAFT_338832 [Cryphonectria parasitica EP155]KAF3765351.1 hypothetical protein M406DRAFT_338832 [Cryphonectria parasitica EP155]